MSETCFLFFRGRSQFSFSVFAVPISVLVINPTKNRAVHRLAEPGAEDGQGHGVGEAEPKETFSK
jgi:hypothetical protein